MGRAAQAKRERRRVRLSDELFRLIKPATLAAALTEEARRLLVSRGLDLATVGFDATIAALGEAARVQADRWEADPMRMLPLLPDEVAGKISGESKTEVH
jgi:hypothetical protein